MSYTPEITRITITDQLDEEVATIEWVDEVTLQIMPKVILTNAKDWPDLSAAIHASLTTMEQSTRQAQAAINEATP